MGLSPWQRLRKVELPLAAPAILAGVRVSVTIAIGTATIGSTVGALTLGTPIFDGLAANKLPYVIQGAVLVALFAILTDMLFARLERYVGGPSSPGARAEPSQSALVSSNIPHRHFGPNVIEEWNKPLPRRCASCPDVDGHATVRGQAPAPQTNLSMRSSG